LTHERIRRLVRLEPGRRLPNPAEDLDDDPEDEPIVIEGEPLSETIIRERRREAENPTSPVPGR
jgi:hypothetical protein